MSNQAEVDPLLAEDASAIQEEETYLIPGVSTKEELNLFDRKHRIKRVVDEKSSVGTFVLPGGVMLEGELLREVEVVELDGEDEDILVSDATLYPLRLNSILSRKIRRLGHITDREKITRIVPVMSVLDRATVVVCTRRVTHGDIIHGLEFRCDCGHKNQASPDLATVTYIRPLKPEKLEWEFVLPKASRREDREVRVKWHIFNGERELRIARISKQIGSRDMLTWRIMARVLEIGDKPMGITEQHFNSDGTVRQDKGLVDLFRAIKGMSQADRNALRNEFARVEGDIDLSVRAKCANPLCPNPENEFTIDITDRNFFFPETGGPSD